MRRSDRELTDRAKLEEILDAAEALRLAMISRGEPYLVPLNFVRLGNELYFHSANEGRKIEALEGGGRVCFEAEGNCEVEPAAGTHCTTYYESVIGWGMPEPLRDAGEKLPVLAALNRKYGAEAGPFPEELVASTAVWRIRIEVLTGKAKRRKA